MQLNHHELGYILKEADDFLSTGVLPFNNFSQS